jgi:hypothetical protein
MLTGWQRMPQNYQRIDNWYHLQYDADGEFDACSETADQ